MKKNKSEDRPAFSNKKETNYNWNLTKLGMY